jgi:hypothetical protein
LIISSDSGATRTRDPQLRRLYPILNNKHVTPAKDGQLIPAKGGQEVWLLQCCT